MKVDIWIRKKSRYLNLYIEYNVEKGAFREHQLEMSNIRVNKGFFGYERNGRPGTLSYTVTISSQIHRTHAEIVEILAHEEGVQFIEELQLENDASKEDISVWCRKHNKNFLLCLFG